MRWPGPCRARGLKPFRLPLAIEMDFRFRIGNDQVVGRWDRIDERPEGIVLVDYDKCIGCGYCAWACPYGARELDESQKVMKKCTLCVDRIYDAALPERDRRPACVLACPTGARLFGDIHDPASAASVAIREHGGYDLMPEWGTQPANHYLPRRKTARALHPDELQRHDNPLKVDGLLPKPSASEPALDDVTSW